ncbi:hypothetical protein PP301_gp093 [Gordonia phage GMA2]|uniref:Uncharacterized protein n=1 Tax=Gordonia phage GMA2 TaxID=1647283 RepID=A0A0K0N6R3_9CAUD|nr:hypothetical protein PP301_gp093 [Gordonia phage GMA2]AKJ72629.1 hypothetical protein GMA2_91 [Gordonia phage GMA2]
MRNTFTEPYPDDDFPESPAKSSEINFFNHPIHFNKLYIVKTTNPVDDKDELFYAVKITHMAWQVYGASRQTYDASQILVIRPADKPTTKADADAGAEIQTLTDADKVLQDFGMSRESATRYSLAQVIKSLTEKRDEAARKEAERLTLIQESLRRIGYTAGVKTTAEDVISRLVHMDVITSKTLDEKKEN